MATPNVFRARPASPMVRPGVSSTPSSTGLGPSSNQQSRPIVAPVAIPAVKPHLLGTNETPYEMKDVDGPRRGHKRHRAAYEHKHRERNRDDLSGSQEHFRTTAFRPYVRADAQGKAYVTRAYQSNAVIVENKTGQDNQGSGLSLQLMWSGVGDGGLEGKVMGGGPSSGTDVGVVFGNLTAESLWFSKVFRYVKLKKFQINVTRMPQQVMMGTLVVPGADAGSTQVVQNGYQSNMMDPGYVILRPWAGEPQVASFTDGTLSSTEWGDYMRHKEKVVFPAASSRGAQQIKKMCVQPISVAVMPEDSSDAAGDNVYNYIPTQPCDFNRLRTNSVSLNSYGIVWWWYYPASSGAVDNAFKLSFTFEIELAYYGLAIPTAVPELPLGPGKVYEDDPAADLLDDVEVVERPDPPPSPEPVVWKRPDRDQIFKKMNAMKL